MDYKFLDKVIDQIVSETIIDWDEGMVNVPFHPFFIGPHLLSHNPFHFPFPSFTKHCNEVYGLNIEETEYVWEEYRRIIKDKIENNGI